MPLAIVATLCFILVSLKGGRELSLGFILAPLVLGIAWFIFRVYYVSYIEPTKKD